MKTVERVVSYTIIKKGRKYWTAQHSEKGWEAKIVIDDLTADVQIGETYRFLAQLEIDQNKYGTTVTVTAINMDVSEDLEEVEQMRSIENIVAYIEKKAKEGEWHSMGIEKLAGFPDSLTSQYQERIEAAKTIYEQKKIKEALSYIESKAREGYLYTKYVDVCKKHNIEKYPELHDRLNAAKDTAVKNETENDFRSAKKKIKSRHSEKNNEWYRNSSYFSRDLMKCESAAKIMSGVDEKRASEMIAEIESLKAENLAIKATKATALAQTKAEIEDFDFETLKGMSDETIKNLDTRIKKQLAKRGFATEETGIDTTNEARDDDFTVYTYYVITRENLEALRAEYPFCKEIADENEIKKQEAKMAKEALGAKKQALKDYLRDDKNIVKYGSGMTDEEEEIVRYSPGFRNPFASEHDTVNKFVVFGDLVWHFHSYWLDGRYELFCAYKREEILPLFEGIVSVNFATRTKAEYDAKIAEEQEREHEIRAERQKQKNEKAAIFDSLAAISPDAVEAFKKQAEKAGKGDKMFYKYVELSGAVEMKGEASDIELLKKHGYDIKLCENLLYTTRSGEWKIFQDTQNRPHIFTNANAYTRDAKSWAAKIKKIYKEAF